MARIRTIKPELPHSESLGRVSRDARLLFMLMFTLADDEGRLRASSRLLASLLYPHDREETDLPGLIDGWLRELSREECVIVYDIGDKQHIAFVNWLKHQKIDKPSRSKLPPPPSQFAKPRECSSSDQGKGSGSRIKDLDQDQEEEGTARSRSREEANEKSGGTKNSDWPADYRDQFEAAYPNKVAMAAGLKALDGLHAEGRVSWRVMSAALASYAAKTDDRAWMNPKNWLEQERWNDKPAKPPVAGANGQQRRESPGDRARRLAEQVAAAERAAADSRPSPTVGGVEVGGDDARCVSGAKPER